MASIQQRSSSFTNTAPGTVNTPNKVDATSTNQRSFEAAYKRVEHQKSMQEQVVRQASPEKLIDASAGSPSDSRDIDAFSGLQYDEQPESSTDDAQAGIAAQSTVRELVKEYQTRESGLEVFALAGQQSANVNPEMIASAASHVDIQEFMSLLQYMLNSPKNNLATERTLTFQLHDASFPTTQISLTQLQGGQWQLGLGMDGVNKELLAQHVMRLKERIKEQGHDLESLVFLDAQHERAGEPFDGEDNA